MSKFLSRVKTRPPTKILVVFSHEGHRRSTLSVVRESNGNSREPCQIPGVLSLDRLTSYLSILFHFRAGTF